MCDTPFKTPLPYRSERTFRSDLNRDMFGEKAASDSDESIASSNSDNVGSGATQSSNGDISLVAHFDDLRRNNRRFRCSYLELLPAYIDTAEEAKFFLIDYYEAVNECRRLQSVLDSKILECSDLEHKLVTARQMIDKEKKMVRTARKERDDLVSVFSVLFVCFNVLFQANQINLVKDLLFKDKSSYSRFSDEMRRKFAFLNKDDITSFPSEWETSSAEENGNGQPLLSTIKEINSTGKQLQVFMINSLVKWLQFWLEIEREL